MKPARGSLLIPVALAFSALACGLPQTVVPTPSQAATAPVASEVLPAASPAASSTCRTSPAKDRLLAGAWDAGIEKVILVGLEGSVIPLADGSLAGRMLMP